VRGSQVAPAELEALLLEHPQILDAAVIGVKTASHDEDPRAYIVLRQPGAVSEDEIVHFVASKVAKVKRLTGGVKFVQAIPKNPVNSPGEAFLVRVADVDLVWEDPTETAERFGEAGERGATAGAFVVGRWHGTRVCSLEYLRWK
jgi:hypothetical protein